MVRVFYELTKPGIIYGNALSAAAGYFIGAGTGFLPLQFILALLGTCFIVGAGCVFNNYFDRDIDAKMERTKNRALVRGAVSLHDALAFGILLALFGTTLLYLADILALAVALFGLFVYAVVYTMWCKRHTLHATVIGAVSGAVPPVIGYAAATNSLDLGALILFLILFTWQMPHALAIAIRRLDDYRAAGIPVMPVQFGMFPAKVQILVYAGAFGLAVTSLSLAGYAGRTFLWVMAVLSALWILLCIEGFRVKDDKIWAKRVFRFSLIIICAFCILSAFNALIP